MLTVDSVSAGYGKLHILTEVSIRADPGQITVIVGPNGSGKSTMLKTIAGLVSIYSGSIRLNNEIISGLAPYAIAKKGLAYLPQNESVFTNLTVGENIMLAGYTVSKPDFESRLANAMLMFPSIKQYMKTKTQNLSGGERQMVAMTMALVRKPSVIMLDEPTANLSPKLANQVLKNVESLAKQAGLAVLLVEQNARRALEIGDSAYLFVSGRKIFDGTAKDLLAHQELSQLYLGLKAAA
jgi:branched-chain amino acid transport system ATP-binding protein